MALPCLVWPSLPSSPPFPFLRPLPSPQEVASLLRRRVCVSECLDLFAKREQLQESEMWYCAHCKEHRPAWKELRLWKAPPILVRPTVISRQEGGPQIKRPSAFIGSQGQEGLLTTIY